MDTLSLQGESIITFYKREKSLQNPLVISEFNLGEKEGIIAFNAPIAHGVCHLRKKRD